jgi:Mobilization protein NikA
MSVPVDPAEFLCIAERAQNAGLSRGAFLRACALGAPGPRACRRPSIDIEALARATAALNKVGSNLNQIARILNTSGSIGIAHASFAALTETRAAVTEILQLVGRRDRS